MDGIAGQKAPWHLWVIGIVSLLWNTVNGAIDHVLIGIRDPAYMADIADVLGVPLRDVHGYYDGMLLWGSFGWAVAVWGLIAGSAFLLLRSKYALHAFGLSLIGQVVSAYYYSIIPLPRVAGDQVVEFIDWFQQVAGVIGVIVTMLVMLYSFLMTRNRVLD